MKGYGPYFELGIISRCQCQMESVCCSPTHTSEVEYDSPCCWTASCMTMTIAPTKLKSDCFSQINVWIKQNMLEFIYILNHIYLVTWAKNQSLLKLLLPISYTRSWRGYKSLYRFHNPYCLILSTNRLHSTYMHKQKQEVNSNNHYYV